ncbi:MAG: hypothetical protein QGG73_10945 [Candidatus Hydrogenedentes bacterium]|jgi:hypothetical protein|nr:hypothetical protein [Candidatus Hydrogenedentota bacterium]
MDDNRLEPVADPPDYEDDEAIGGEIRVAGGGLPKVLRWGAYLAHVWAVLYLVVHPSVPYREILFVFAALIGAWLLFFALAKRPPEL